MQYSFVWPLPVTAVLSVVMWIFNVSYLCSSCCVFKQAESLSLQNSKDLLPVLQTLQQQRSISQCFQQWTQQTGCHNPKKMSSKIKGNKRSTAGVHQTTGARGRVQWGKKRKRKEKWKNKLEALKVIKRKSNKKPLFYWVKGIKKPPMHISLHLLQGVEIQG